MLTDRDYEIINKITREIYRTKGSVAMRENMLFQLRQLIDFKFSVFSLGGVKRQIAYLTDSVVVSNFEKAFEERFIKLSESKYSASDYASWVFQIPESVVYKDSEIVDDLFRKKTYYYEYLQENDLPYVAGLSIVCKKQFRGAMTLYKSEKSGDFTEKDMFILRLLLPHLEARFTEDEEKTIDNRKNVSYLLKNHYNMTSREIEVMGLVFQGKRNEEIADLLVISTNTVKKHLSHIFEKIHVSNRSQLVRFIHDNEIGEMFR